MVQQTEQFIPGFLWPPLYCPGIGTVMLDINHRITLGSIFLQVSFQPFQVALTIGSIAGISLPMNKMHVTDIPGITPTRRMQIQNFLAGQFYTQDRVHIIFYQLQVYLVIRGLAFCNRIQVMISKTGINRKVDSFLSFSTFITLAVKVDDFRPCPVKKVSSQNDGIYLPDNFP